MQTLFVLSGLHRTFPNSRLKSPIWEPPGPRTVSPSTCDTSALQHVLQFHSGTLWHRAIALIVIVCYFVGGGGGKKRERDLKSICK